MYVTEIKCKSVRGHGMFGGHGRQNETTKTSKSMHRKNTGSTDHYSPAKNV